MALRSLGTSLLAKNKPGSAFREQKTRRVETPKLPEKGEVGTARRKLVQEPLERKVPAGSDKVVTAKPTIEETATPGEALPGQASTPNLLGGGNGKVVGFPGGRAPAQAGGALTSMISPNVSPPRVASQAAPGGRRATAVSGGEAPGAGVAVRTTPEVQGKSVEVQAPKQPRVRSFGEGSLPSLGTDLGGVSIADEGVTPAPVPVQENAVNPTFLQTLLGFVGKGLSNIGQSSGNVGQSELGNRLQTFGGAATPAVAGVGSITRPIREAIGNLRSKGRSIFDKLRSRFGI